MAKKGTAGAKKTVCPIGKAAFLAVAAALTGVVRTKLGEEFVLSRKVLSQGTKIGYYSGGKLTVSVDGTPVKCQVGINVVMLDEQIMTGPEWLENPDAAALGKKIHGMIAGGESIAFKAMEFGTGSFGWNGNGKVAGTIGTKDVRFQVGVNVTVIGSKPEAAAAEAA